MFYLNLIIFSANSLYANNCFVVKYFWIRSHSCALDSYKYSFFCNQTTATFAISNQRMAKKPPKNDIKEALKIICLGDSAVGKSK